MDAPSSLSGSPLQPVSDERVNQQHRDSGAAAALFSSRGGGHSRDSSVSDKISQFNTLSGGSLSKQLERKTADAALKRAMLGREEAETEMRRFRDEMRMLRKQVDEGKERERRVGERLETVMENYGRAKETHAHTQALWEKEIRRARKETFKSQSSIVKLQEELKSARSCVKVTEENLEREKERSRAREQEAFQARYEIVGCQGQLQQSLEQIKVLEQERDAFKSLAKSEEDVAKIAAEGLLPLPKASEQEEDDEFASPKKKPRVSSVAIADVRSSAASEAEIEELTRLWQWEKQRANRNAEQVHFLEAECEMRACSCMKKRPRSSTIGSACKRPALDIRDGGDMAILSETGTHSPTMKIKANISPKKLNLKKPKEPRRSTIFVPEEGVFRTVSQEIAEAMEVTSIPIEESGIEPLTPAEPDATAPHFARTPSVDPPSFAMLAQKRASLISLLEAPHQMTEPPLIFNIPTTPGPVEHTVVIEEQHDIVMQEEIHEVTVIATKASTAEEEEDDVLPDLEVRPHTSAALYATKTTTTKVPLREENTDPSLAKRIWETQQQTPSQSRSHCEPSFDASNPALTPTMTREQALAQIRERRGRARSAAGGALTPRKQMVEGKERRDISAPVGACGSMKRARSRVG